MRKNISLILMETEDGKVSVSLYEGSLAAGAFGEMVGNPGDPKIRATLVDIDFDGSSALVKSKNLPNPKKEEFDAWVLGKGPANFEKEEEV